MRYRLALSGSKQKEYNSVLLDYFESFEVDKQPIEVNFRKLVGELQKTDRASHLIHTYPAKLLMHIPYFFLNNNVLTQKGDLVLDPFCGSGTVLLESILAGRNAVGSDSNPLARLITEVKVFNYEINKLEELLEEISASFDDIAINDSDKYPDVVNIDYWFLPEVKDQLLKLKKAIEQIDEEKYRKFFLVCFSNCIRKVSLADPRISVPVKLKVDKYPEDSSKWRKTKKRLDTLSEIDVEKKFKKICQDNIDKYSDLDKENSNETLAKVISSDARNIEEKLKLSSKTIDSLKSKVDLIITSPPYAGAQKYIRSSGLNLGWLGYTKNENLKQYKVSTIGREGYRKAEYSNLSKTGLSKADNLLEKIFAANPKRAHIAANYLIEMKEAISESVKVLKKGGYFVLVIANNEVCGFDFKTQEYLQEILENAGLQLNLALIDDIKSYGLMTKRNKTASIITREWILVFKK